MDGMAIRRRKGKSERKDSEVRLRVTEAEELRGLDVSQHGEEAYND